MDDDDLRELMHAPLRADNLLSMEEHLNCAAYLTRAMWLVTTSSELNTEDKRDHDAIRELASVAAEHVSAARYLFYRKNER
jgi:hypothetical protein